MTKKTMKMSSSCANNKAKASLDNVRLFIKEVKVHTKYCSSIYDKLKTLF